MKDIATEKSLTPSQRKAIESLLTAGNVTAAAQTAGVNRGTIYRWMDDSFFVTALREAESEAVAGLSRSLAGLGESAAAALRDALDASQKVTIRLRASEIVIANLLRIRELVDIESRLQALEGANRENEN